MTSQLELSVVVPAYNEERRLPPTLIDMIDILEGSGLQYEIIVVDDGSSDATAEVTRKCMRLRPQVQLIQLPQNRGKGCAVKTGMLSAKAPRVLFADADGSTPFSEIFRLQQALDSGADVAIGSRALTSAETSIQTRWYRKWLGRVFNTAVNGLILPGIADTQCGFKLFTRSAAQFLFSKQTSEGFSFDVEILFLARKVGMTIKEVPINWVNVAGSKVNLVVDSARMLRDVFIFRYKHRNVSKICLDADSLHTS